jgi:hypothetical protein
MLFDLRGRGRRRAVRVIYIGLAVLLGVGLVGFGVGGGFGGGGVLNSITKGEGGGSASFAKQVATYRKLTQQQPQNQSAWENLTKVLLNEAGRESNKSTSGTPTASGRRLYSEAAEAWTHYIALKPAKPSIPLAKEMVLIYGEEGLNQPSNAVQVLQLVVASEPTNASYYGALAEYAYLARDDNLGDLASAKAVSLAPVGQRVHLKTQLAAIKKAVHEKQSSSSSTGTTGTVTTGGLGGATVTTGGTTAKK